MMTREAYEKAKAAVSSLRERGAITLAPDAARKLLDILGDMLEGDPWQEAGDAARILDLLANVLDEDGTAYRKRQSVVAPSSPRRCKVNMVHEDKSESRCVLDKDHLLDATDHLDIHGHKAPVLVHQSTIRQVEAIAAMRERGEIE